MDVKCEKCGTEYEFDDAKVTESGITVKCTNCGHLFRVVRHRVVFDDSPVASEPEPNPPAARPPGNQWRIRTRGGDTRAFKDLATLQQWIVQGKVSRDDQISKTGDNWKPLGSIVELASFFPGEHSPAPAPVAAEAPTVQLTPAPGPAPPPPQGRHDLLDTGEFRLEGPDDRPTIRTPAPDLHEISRSGGLDALLTPATRPPHRAQRHRPPPPPPGNGQVSITRTPAPGLGPQATPLAFDGEPPPPYRGAGSATTRGFLIGVLATVALAGVAYFVFDQVRDGRGGRSARGAPVPAGRDLSATRRMIEGGEVWLRQDTIDGLDRADAAFVKAIGSLGEPPVDRMLALRARLGRARAATTRAEYARLEARDPAADLDTALGALAAARTLAAEDPRVLLGFADYYRVVGQPDLAVHQLDRAAAAGGSATEVEFERAALDMHRDPGDPQALARALSAISPEARRLPRAQYLQAVAYKRAGRDEDATQTLVELVAANKGHSPGSRMLEALGAAPRRAAPDTGAVPPPVVVDAPVPVAAGLPAPPPVEPKPPVQPLVRPDPPVDPKPKVDPKPRVEPRPAQTRPAAPSPVTAPASYDGMLQSGYKLLEAGKSSQARHIFEAAAQLRPQSPEPWANLGWCDLDLKRLISAVDNFKTSLARNPRYADGMYGLAVAYERAGRSEDAVRSYRAYLDAHPRGRKAGMVQRKLDHLR